MLFWSKPCHCKASSPLQIALRILKFSFVNQSTILLTDRQVPESMNPAGIVLHMSLKSGATGALYQLLQTGCKRPRLCSALVGKHHSQPNTVGLHLCLPHYLPCICGSGSTRDCILNMRIKALKLVGESLSVVHASHTHFHPPRLYVPTSISAGFT